MSPLLVGPARTVRQRELTLLARAAISSCVATAVDAFVYTATTAAFAARSFPRLYLVAAAAAGAAGAVTHFTLNRRWAFRSRQSLFPEAAKYLVASLLTLLALQATLVALVEGARLHATAAWPLAKVASWLVVSFPLQRTFVFSDRHP